MKLAKSINLKEVKERTKKGRIKNIEQKGNKYEDQFEPKHRRG